MVAPMVTQVVASGVVCLAVDDHARRDRGVREPVDHDEAAGRAVAAVGVVGDGACQRDGAAADLVERKRRGGLAVERVDVDAVAERTHRAGDDLARLLEEVLPARHQRLLGHPDDHRLEPLVDLRHVARTHEHVAAARIDFVLEGQRDRLGSEGLVEFAIERDDRLHAALLARGERHHLVPAADDARGDRAREAAVVEVGPQHHLHRKAEVLEVAVGADIDRLQECHQRAAGVPRHIRAVGHDVVALERRDRHEMDVGQLQPRGEVDVVGFDPLEHRLVIAHDVHLVDGDDDVLDPQERHDEAVPLRLRQDAVAGVDQDDGQIGGRGPGRHVPRVLLVARRVGDDELPPVGREIAVGHVDRDALLPFVLQTVGEQREIDILTGGAIPRGVFADGGELVLVDHLRLVEEPADERALAVVDAAAGDEPEQFLALMLREVGVDVGGDEGGLV